MHITIIFAHGWQRDYGDETLHKDCNPFVNNFVYM